MNEVSWGCLEVAREGGGIRVGIVESLVRSSRVLRGEGDWDRAGVPEKRAKMLQSRERTSVFRAKNPETA